MYGSSPFEPEADESVLRVSAEVTDVVCQATSMLSFGRRCGCKMVRLSLSPALQAAAARVGVKATDGELVCFGGRTCAISAGLRLSALMELLR